MKTTKRTERESHHEGEYPPGPVVVFLIYVLMLPYAVSFQARKWGRACSHWFQRKFVLRRECCWCRPPHYIGGNPWSKQVTSGMCGEAFARLSSEVEEAKVGKAELLKR